MNNRPGRFDVVIELPAPTSPCVSRTSSCHLPNIGDEVLRKTAADADGLAFGAPAGDRAALGPSRD